jgi:hypothetical protein
MDPILFAWRVCNPGVPFPAALGEPTLSDETLRTETEIAAKARSNAKARLKAREQRARARVAHE